MLTTEVRCATHVFPLHRIASQHLIMLQKAEATLLEQLEGSIAVDADTMNADFIRSLPIKCHDMTSNQRFVHEALTAEHNKAIVEGAVKELKGKSWEEVYATCVSICVFQPFEMLYSPGWHGVGNLAHTVRSLGSPSVFCP